MSALTPLLGDKRNTLIKPSAGLRHTARRSQPVANSFDASKIDHSPSPSGPPGPSTDGDSPSGTAGRAARSWGTGGAFSANQRRRPRTRRSRRAPHYLVRDAADRLLERLVSGHLLQLAQERDRLLSRHVSKDDARALRTVSRDATMVLLLSRLGHIIAADDGTTINTRRTGWHIGRFPPKARDLCSH